MDDILYPRSLEALIAEELLREFPAVLVVGPRSCGKSTLLSPLADTVLDLADPGIKAAVDQDPRGLLARTPGSVMIDEWQEAPEILGAVKHELDNDRSNNTGRFVITGSVTARNQAATWPGTGRIIRVQMYGLAQSEIEGDAAYNPVDTYFNAGAGDTDFSPSASDRDDYVNRIVRGRFPMVVDRTGRARSRWFNSYVEQLVDRDALQVAVRTPQPQKLRSFLNSCAARTGQPLKKQAAAADADVNVKTADRYLSLLEDLSMIRQVPTWNDKRLKRLTQSPKVHLTDPGLAAHLLNIDENGLAGPDMNSDLAGQLFETFVAMEVATHLETTAAVNETRMMHVRTAKGEEVDIVLEQGNKIVGLEVKSGTKVDRNEAKGLFWLRDKIGDRFHFGAVLYSGKLPFQIDGNIWALPISTLWNK